MTAGNLSHDLRALQPSCRRARERFRAHLRAGRVYPEQEDELSPRPSQTLPWIGYAGRRVFPHKTADISGRLAEAHAEPRSATRRALVCIRFGIEGPPAPNCGYASRPVISARDLNGLSHLPPASASEAGYEIEWPRFRLP